jgi:hypothetical protein
MAGRVREPQVLEPARILLQYLGRDFYSINLG